VVGVPGDREVDLKRLGASVAPAVPEPFDEQDFADYPVLVRGYIGPQILGADAGAGIRYLVDPRVVPGTRWITGANEAGRHVFDLVAGRDFGADGTVEAAEIRNGDPCPRCGGVLEIARGLEIGHIFQLGRKYAEALDLTVQDEAGRQVVVTMGSYGVGVSRLVAAIAEQTHDDLGLCWPALVSPADVHVVAAGKDDAVAQAAADLAAGVSAAGFDVLLDDRPGSAGVKFADAELIGVPLIVVVGRGLASGVVEVRERHSGQRSTVPVQDAVRLLVDRIGAARTAE
jgi:prolyl-tRNA synthetase